MFHIKPEHCVTDETRLLYNVCILLDRLIAIQEPAESTQADPAPTPQPAPKIAAAPSSAITGAAKKRARRPATKTKSKG